MANAPAVPSPLALLPYAERFLDGRRVVLFGDATAGLAEEAADRGARVVHVLDVDATRVAEAVATAPRGLSFSVLRDGGDGALRDGAFDTCLIPDLSLFSDPRAIIAQARKLLAAGGVVIAATPRVDGRRGESLRGKGGPLNYYDFYDVLARQFPAVSLAGQVPFHGYALVNFSLEGDPEVSVDASLTDGADREPVAYVAFASDRRIAIDPYAIIQLPNEEAEAPAVAAPVVDTARVTALEGEVESLQAAKRAAEQRLAEEQRRSADLGRALHEAGALPRQLEHRLTEEARRAEVLAGQISRNQEATERAQREMRTLQDQSKQAARQLTEVQAKLAQATQREEALTRRVRELEGQPRGVDQASHDELRQRHQAVEQERDTFRQHLERERTGRERDREAARQQVERETARLQAERESSRQQAEREREAARREIERENGTLQRRVAQLESQLAEARQRTTSLSADAAQAQTDQAEQVADLSAAESALRGRAREVAQLKAEIERRGAMVRELVQALESREPIPLGPAGALDRERLAYLERELEQTRARAEQASALADRREAELASAQALLATQAPAATPDSDPTPDAPPPPAAENSVEAGPSEQPS